MTTKNIIRKGKRAWGILSRIAFAIMFTLCLNSCRDSDEDDRAINNRALADHSTLIYIVADNNLSDYGKDSFERIQKAYYNAPNKKDGNIFVYLDNHDELPALYWLDPEYGITQISNYQEQNSVSPSVIRHVCTQAFNSGRRTNSVNSVIFWSHGTNWFPAPDNKGSRSFGKDNADEINIPEMAAALKGLSINNLMFDACLMGSVEVAAEFAGIADVLVASPAEILTTSFPYHTIIPALCTPNPDMHKIVDLYYAYYNSLSEQYKSGILTAVELSGINKLAEEFGRLKAASYSDAHLPSITAMTYDRENVHLFFDLKQFARMCHDKIAADDEQKAENLHDNFLKAYNACKVYTRHTDRFMSINLRGACGLSVYVPGPSIVSRLDEYYQNLAWYKWSH